MTRAERERAVAEHLDRVSRYSGLIDGPSGFARATVAQANAISALALVLQGRADSRQEDE